VSPAPRVVSLVPSATETLLALGVTPVACTRFCDVPGIATVGGTKNPDIAAIAALEPDLVVVNDEENRQEDAAALEAAGLKLHAMSPRHIADVEPAVRALAGAVGAFCPSMELPDRIVEYTTAFVAVWRRPYMALNADTYGSSLLAHIGVGNVFADATERYPAVSLAEVAARAPALVILPSEPYAFTAAHGPEVQAAVPGARVVFVDGRDLFWWGTRTPAAAARLHEAIA